jgi:hypothetical protein
MKIARLAVLALLTCAFLDRAATARADSFVGLAEPDYASPLKAKQAGPIASRHVTHLVYPVLGFPSLVEPSGSIPARVLLKDGGGTSDFAATLVSQGPLTPRVALRATGTRTYDPLTGVYVVDFEVPAGTAPAVYDLELTSAQFPTDRQPCCVRVLPPDHLERGFAVVSDTQAQDIRTTVLPQRIEQMLSEVRLRDPAFVVYCGDVNFGTDYATEYEENWQLFARSGLAIFFTPGNHDGYATVIPMPAPAPPRVDRDGLDSFKQTFGPILYSFDWGRYHFVSVNSFGGPPERRNALGILCTNYGGQIEAPELAWLEKDVKDATARGKESILFMHHNHAGSFKPNGNSYPFPVPALANQDWNDTVSRDQLERIVGQNKVTHVLYGHIHQDAYDERTVAGKVVKYVATTTLSCGSASRFGYRWLTTKAGAIQELHYMGTQQQSVPIPAVGVNVAAVFSGRNDGTEESLDATITSRLLQPAGATVELFVKPGRKLRARGAGVLESVTTTAAGRVARVRANVAASAFVVVGVEPEPAPAPPSTAPVTSGIVTPGSTVSPLLGGGGHGGSGCALGAGEADPRAAASLVLLLFLLLGVKSKLVRCSGGAAR